MAPKRSSEGESSKEKKSKTEGPVVRTEQALG